MIKTKFIKDFKFFLNYFFIIVYFQKINKKIIKTFNCRIQTLVINN